MRITLTEKGTGIAAGRLRDLAHRSEDATEVFGKIARLLMRDEAERFSRSRWTPLDPDTVRQKAKAKRDPRILRATGRLRAALTVWGFPGQRLDIGPDELVFGLDDQGPAYYGKFHQRGEGVPKRTIVQATPNTRREVREALLDHLLGRY